MISEYYTLFGRLNCFQQVYFFEWCSHVTARYLARRVSTNYSDTSHLPTILANEARIAGKDEHIAYDIGVQAMTRAINIILAGEQMPEWASYLESKNA